MKEHDSFIGIRIPSSLKTEIDKLIESGKFKNASEIVRQALTEFLTKNKPVDDILREAFSTTEGIDT